MPKEREAIIEKKCDKGQNRNTDTCENSCQIGKQYITRFIKLVGKNIAKLPMYGKKQTHPGKTDSFTGCVFNYLMSCSSETIDYVFVSRIRRTLESMIRWMQKEKGSPGKRTELLSVYSILREQPSIRHVFLIP